MQEIILERDIDEDRYISPKHYLELISSFQPLSKYQFYFITLAETGWRPHEACQANINDFNFDDPNDPYAKWRIGKPAIQRYYGKKTFYLCPKCNGEKEIEGETCDECSGAGKFEDDVVTKIYKVKKRKITLSYAKIVQEYIKLHALAIGECNGFLFPSRVNCKGDLHMDVTTMQTVLQRQRRMLFNKDPVKYSWINEPFKKIIYPDGRVQEWMKVSLYAFRKLHATTYAQNLLDRGYTDILLATAQHMGHSNPRTTMRYIKQLIDERPIVNSAFKKIEGVFDLGLPKLDKNQQNLMSYFGHNPL